MDENQAGDQECAAFVAYVGKHRWELEGKHLVFLDGCAECAGSWVVPGIAEASSAVALCHGEKGQIHPHRRHHHAARLFH